MLFRSILATLDCAELHEGINVVPVRVVLPDSYKVASKKPAKISVRVEKKLIQKKNTVIKFKQTLGGNKEIGKIEMSHRQMKVTGPKSMLRRVHHIEVPVSDADIMRINRRLVRIDRSYSGRRPPRSSLTSRPCWEGRACPSRRRVPPVPRAPRTSCREGPAARQTYERTRP